MELDRIQLRRVAGHGLDDQVVLRASPCRAGGVAEALLSERLTAEL